MNQYGGTAGRHDPFGPLARIVLAERGGYVANTLRRIERHVGQRIHAATDLWPLCQQRHMEIDRIQNEAFMLEMDSIGVKETSQEWAN